MNTWKKVALGTASAFALALGGYLAGYMAVRDCREGLRRKDAELGATKAALEEQRASGARARAEEQRKHALVEVRAQLLHALLEVHAKNFGLASKHIELAARQLAIWRKGASKRKDDQLDDVSTALSKLYERVLLLDARVVADLKQLVAKLRDFTPPPRSPPR